MTTHFPVQPSLTPTTQPRFQKGHRDSPCLRRGGRAAFMNLLPIVSLTLSPPLFSLQPLPLCQHCLTNNPQGAKPRGIPWPPATPASAGTCLAASPPPALTGPPLPAPQPCRCTCPQSPSSGTGLSAASHLQDPPPGTSSSAGQRLPPFRRLPSPATPPHLPLLNADSWAPPSHPSITPTSNRRPRAAIPPPQPLMPPLSLSLSRPCSLQPGQPLLALLASSPVCSPTTAVALRAMQTRPGFPWLQTFSASRCRPDEVKTLSSGQEAL